jgi:hypothetical protein
MDENLHNNVDIHFRDTLQQYKANPSENVWNKIEDELEKEEKGITIFGSPRIAILAVCLIILSGVCIYISWQKNNGLIFIGGSQQQVKTGKSLKAPLSIINKHETGHLPKQNILLQIPAEETTSAGPYFNSRNRNQTVTFSNFYLPPVVEIEKGIRSFHNDPDIQPEVIAIKEDVLIHQDKQRFTDRFSITPYYSHEFAGYNPVDKDIRGPNGKEQDVQQRNVFSASAGAYFNIKVKKKWVIQSGVSYSWADSYIDSSKSYAVKDYNGDILFKLNTNSGYGYLKPNSVVPPNVGDSILTAKTYSKLNYLTIPLVVSYNISMKRFSLQVGGGITFNIKTSGTLETRTYGTGYPEKEYDVNILGLKKTNFGMILKADLEYHMNSRFGIDLIPCFKNTLGPINLPGALSAFPYNFGIGLGVSYRL